MAHITGLSLGNFKVFKETTHFEFSPITILTGGNNVGKSAVLKALLLIADNAKKTQFLELDFSGDKHNLDTFDYTINKGADSDLIEIGFELSQLYGLYLPNKHRGIDDVFYYNDYSSNSKLLLKYIKNKNGGKLIEYKLECENKTIFIVKYDLEKRHSIYVNLKWLVEKADIKKRTLTEYGTNVINEIFKDFEEIERLKLIKVLEDEFLNYLSKAIIDKEDWYKTEITGDIYVEMMRQNDEFDIDELDDIWHEKKFNLINDYEKKLSEDKLYKNANYETILHHFSLKNGYSNKKNQTKKISELLNNTEFDAYKNRLYDYRVKDFYVDLDEVHRLLMPNRFSEFISYVHENFPRNIEVNYIANFRANSKRLYSNQHQGTDFNELLLEIHRTKFQKENKQFIQDWLKIFGIGDDIHFTWFKGVATEVKIEKNGNLIDLVDLGFGFTQIIPIILKIALITNNKDEYGIENVENEINKHIDRNQYTLNSDGLIRIKNLNNNYEKILEDDEQFKNKTFKRNELFDYHVVLLEEPETNLHPNLQSKLADFLLDASKRFNIQFIIETHSEYLIRKLQYLVATKETYPKDVALYYFHDPENVPQGEEQVKKIEILENGKLSDHFGTGFFDEGDKLAIDLFRLNRKKRRGEA